MKKSLVTLLLSILLYNCFSQDLKFNVRGKYSRPVKTEKLQAAKFLSDILPGYPINWISNYVSVEIRATCEGKAMKGVNTNDALTIEQKNILNSADLSTNILINVKHIYPNPVTNIAETREIDITLTVIPEIEAEYIGGYSQMSKYLKQKAVDKISESVDKDFLSAAVIFTVNEKGEMTGVKISRSSGDPTIDDLLLEAINKMPKWKPALDSKGKKVKQEFEFSVGDGGC